MKRTQSGSTYRWALVGYGGLVETMELIASEGAVMSAQDVAEFGNFMKRMEAVYQREATRFRGDTDEETEGRV